MYKHRIMLCVREKNKELYDHLMKKNILNEYIYEKNLLIKEQINQMKQKIIEDYKYKGTDINYIRIQQESEERILEKFEEEVKNSVVK